MLLIDIVPLAESDHLYVLPATIPTQNHDPSKKKKRAHRRLQFSRPHKALCAEHTLHMHKGMHIK